MAEDLQASDPESVGSYRLIQRLGAGGMGQVYLGRSPGGRLVAVKVIRPELAAESGFRARFAREVAAARTVSGMFTAPVVDADTDGPRPWLATVYVPGPSLTEAVAERGPLPAPMVLTLAAGLAEALVAIHSVGLVHRDLKPSNVLLADDGPRVIDFGISRAADASVLTQTGMILGSPGFLSPEQAEGLPVGPPSDVFSLGAVLTFAASGAGPFGEGTVAALVYRVVNAEPNLSGVPAQVRPLVARCLAKDPAARPSAQAILAEAGAGPLTPASWPAGPGVLGTARTQTSMAPTPARAVPAAAVTPPVHSRLPGPTTPARAAGQPPWPAARAPVKPARRSRAALTAAAAVVVLAAAGTGVALAVSGSGHHTLSPPAASASLGRTATAAGSPASSAAVVVPVTSSAPAAPPVDGVWTGTYTCNQGLTGVQLTITGSDGAALRATVNFYPVPSNPGVATGSFAMVGRYSDTSGLVLNPDYWISEPPGYEMVGITAPPLTGDKMSGAVRGENCSTFSVTRG